MKLNGEDRAVICRAFERLRDGDWRRFEDDLWIAFGDRWGRILSALTNANYIRLAGPLQDQPELTERGRTLLNEMAANR